MILSVRSLLARFAGMLLLTAFLAPCTLQAQVPWRSAGTLNVPEYNYTFLSATPEGDLLAATIYSAPSDNPPSPIPALLIRNPTSPNPDVVELSRVPFEPNRGYGGIAADPAGGYFVSGDTGNVESSFIRKFQANGTPDAAFGRNGVLTPGRRCLGIEVFSDYLFVAHDWGRIRVYDVETGEQIGQAPEPGSLFYVRDIGVDPKSLRIFGVSEGALVTWGQGAPWEPANYRFRQLSAKAGEPRAGEGISIDPIRRTVLNTPIPGNVLNELHGSGRIDRYQVSSAAPDAHLADSVLSFDGSTLFISDVTGRAIHLMKRDMSQLESTQGTATAVADATTGNVPPPTWHRSYEDVVRRAREGGEPMIVYFRKDGVEVSNRFENEVLLTDQFNQRAQGFVCVFEDLAFNPLLAYRFGVFRVPHIAILDGQGGTVAEMRHPINSQELFAAMETAGAGGSETGG